MNYRTLGATDLRVSEVGFGCWAIGGPATLGKGRVIGWGDVDDATSVRALHAALDLGVNFFDTADVYGWGRSEEVVGKAFAGRRDKVIIASKVGNRVDANDRWFKDFSPDWIPQAAEQSLKRLRTDYVDLYQLHSPPGDFDYTDDVVAALDRLKEAGKIRFYGISLPTDKFDRLGMSVVGRKSCAAFQVVHSILDRGPEEELFPACLEHNVGIIARVPLASGFLTGKFGPDTTFPPNDHRSQAFPPARIKRTLAAVERLRELIAGKKKTLAQLALQYCLSQPAVSVVIPGAKTPDQVCDNAAASDGVLLSEDELARIREIVPQGG